MKKQCTEWERIFANHMSNEESISKIHREFTQLNHKETKKSIKIWVQNLNRCYHKDDMQMANMHMNIADQQRDANPNHNELLLCT